MAYGNHDYGKLLLPDYWAMLSTLLDELMTFISNQFAQGPVNDRTTPFLSATWPLDWDNYESELKAQARFGWLDCICLTTTHVPQDISAVLHKWMSLIAVSISEQNSQAH